MHEQRLLYALDQLDGDVGTLLGQAYVLWPSLPSVAAHAAVEEHTLG